MSYCKIFMQRTLCFYKGNKITKISYKKLVEDTVRHIFQTSIVPLFLYPGKEFPECLVDAVLQEISKYT